MAGMRLEWMHSESAAAAAAAAAADAAAAAGPRCLAAGQSGNVFEFVAKKVF
jgi:hypothetical protein